MKLSYEQTLKIGIKTFARQGFTNSDTLERCLVWHAPYYEYLVAISKGDITTATQIPKYIESYCVFYVTKNGHTRYLHFEKDENVSISMSETPTCFFDTKIVSDSRFSELKKVFIDVRYYNSVIFREYGMYQIKELSNEERKKYMTGFGC